MPLIDNQDIFYMDLIQKHLQRLENSVIAVCFIIMCLAEFAQVVNRNIVGAGISWFDELARYCMVYLTLLATEAGLRDGSQIAVTAVSDHCPPLIKRILQLIVKFVIVCFSLMIFITSFTIIQTQLNSGQISAGLGIPMVIPYSILPVAFGFITIVQTVAFFILLKKPLTTKDAQE